MPQLGLIQLSQDSYHTELAHGVTGTTNGTWLDVSTLRSFRLTVSGVPGAGTWDALVCNLMNKPDDNDNIHSSLQAGPVGQIGSIYVTAPSHWIKFVTVGVSGTLSCGLMGWVR